MPKQRKNKLFNEVVDFFYSLSIFITLWVWRESDNMWLTGLTFMASLGLLYIGISKYKHWKKRKLLVSSIDAVDNMTGMVFDEYVLAHFENLGYSGHLTPKGEDHGADLILQKDGQKVVVQAKRWKHNVGVDAIDQIIEAIKYYSADKGIVITNSSFAKSAHDIAKSNGVELWDRETLMGLIDKVNKKAIA